MSNQLTIQIPTEPKRINRLAVAELRDLAGKNVALNLDDIIRLHDLCNAIEHPVDVPVLAAGVPVTVGNVTLWPWTIQGQSWYEYAIKGVPKSVMDVYIVAYALAHGRQAGAFDALWVGADGIIDAVGEWRKTIAVTISELSEAIIRVTQSDIRDAADETEPNPKDEPANGTSYGETIADLVAATGLPPEIWERKVCRDYLLQQMVAIHKIRASESGSREMAPPEIEANKRLGRAVYAIIHREADNG